MFLVLHAFLLPRRAKMGKLEYGIGSNWVDFNGSRMARIFFFSHAEGLTAQVVGFWFGVANE